MGTERVTHPWVNRAKRTVRREGRMVGLSGLEPLTSRLSGERSNQLSYRPGFRRARFQLAWKNRVTLVLDCERPMLAP